MPRLRFWTALFAVLILQLGLHTYALASPFEQDQRIARITWKAATRLTGYDIHQKTTPQVRRSPILGEMMNARGAYWCEVNIVWLDTAMTDNTQTWLTIFHEQVHKLQCDNYVDGYGDWDKELNCLVEREANDFTTLYARELKTPQSYIRTDEDWRTIYNCKPNKPIMAH